MNTASLEWIDLVDLIVSAGKTTFSRGFTCIERLNSTTTISMEYPVMGIKERKLNYRFMIAEALFILSGDNTVAGITPWCKKMAEYSDDGEVFFGAYGPRIASQKEYVVSALNADPGTRQAVMTIWRENPPKTKDVPCTVSLQFLVRFDKLHCIANMRSSDAWLGWPYDVFNFSMLSACIALSLKQKVKLGKLYLNAGSQHLYERDIRAARTILACEEEILDCAPIDISTLDKPVDLLNHLECLRDQKFDATPYTFMKEIFNVR